MTAAGSESRSSMHFATAFETVADTVPDADAIVIGDRRWSHRQFDDQAARFAAALDAAGVSAGANVSLYLYNSAEYLIAKFGTFKRGGAAVNVNYRYLDDELLYLLDDSDSEVLVYHSSLADRVERVCERASCVRMFVEVDDEAMDRGRAPCWAGRGNSTAGVAAWGALLAEHAPALRVEHDPSDLYLMYTGGTTGMPKGVMYEQGTLALELYARMVPTQPFVERAPQTPEDIAAIVRAAHQHGPLRSIPCAPLMHGAGMWVGALPALMTGGTVVLLEGRGFDADELWTTVERERPTRLAIVGDAFARPMLRSLEAGAERGNTRDLSSLVEINSSGAMWSAEVKNGLHRFLDVTLRDSLGSTEGGSYGAKPSTADGDGSTARFALAAGTILIDEDHRMLPARPGAHGMLATVTGAMGYFKDPEKTARTFTIIDDQRYVITGDWATIDEDGFAALHGRGSNCINTGGEKVFPEEVEEAVKRHPAVDDCFVVGQPDDRFGNRVVAVVGTSADPAPTGADVRQFVRGQLAGYKVPKQVVLVPAVQRAPNGKADYGWAMDVASGAGTVSLNHPGIA